MGKLSPAAEATILSRLEYKLLSSLTWDQIFKALDSLTDKEKTEFVNLTKTNDYGTLIALVQGKIKSIMRASAQMQLDAIIKKGSLTLDEINVLIQ